MNDILLYITNLASTHECMHGSNKILYFLQNKHYLVLLSIYFLLACTADVTVHVLAKNVSNADRFNLYTIKINHVTLTVLKL